jgi:hypothetical protein
LIRKKHIKQNPEESSNESACKKPLTDSMKEGCKFNFSDLKKQVKLKGLGDLFSGFYHRQDV